MPIPALATNKSGKGILLITFTNDSAELKSQICELQFV